MSEDYVKHSQDEIEEVCGKAMDTREKLEADIAHDFYLYKKPGLERIFGWLDRQAAITEREFIEAECMRCAKADKERESDYSEALAERDDVIAVLKAENAELESRHCEWSDPDSLGDGCMLRKDKRVDELTAERDEWKTKCETREIAYKQADAERKRYSEQIDELTAERDYWRRQFMRGLTFAIRQDDGPNLDKLMSYPKPDDVIEPYQLVTDEINSLRDFCSELTAERDEWKAKAETRNDGVDCGHLADMSAKDAYCVRDGGEMSDVDSREKLEADMKERLGELWASAWNAGSRDSMDDDFDIDVFNSLLDRQVAITERECADTRVNFAERMRFGDKIDELREKIAVLKAENAELQAKLDEWKAKAGKAERAMNKAAGNWCKADDKARYWRSEVEECLKAARIESVSEGVMAYPRHEGYTAPSLLVRSQFDYLDQLCVDLQAKLNELAERKCPATSPRATIAATTTRTSS